MALALDYIGKFTIMLIAITIAVGLIVSTAGDISIGALIPGGDDDQPSGSNLVEVEGNAQQQAQRLADLITLCWDQVQERRHEDFVCFVATKASGSYGITDTSSIEDRLDTTVADNTQIEPSEIQRQTVVIQWSVADRRILVEER